MSYSVTRESLVSVTDCWKNPQSGLKWDSVFVLPSWLKVWWQEFQPDAELNLIAVREDAKIIGIAPLQVKDQQALFIGNVDVCDYMDFIVNPAREHEFCNTLLEDLKIRGIRSLKLEHVRPDSLTMRTLIPVAQSRGLQVVCHENDSSAEMDLPATWEEYLASLPQKQRHEVKRKMRKLGEAGQAEYTEVSQVTPELTATFFRLFTESREDKARFLTDHMESFFRSLIEEMAALGILTFGMLKIDGRVVAMFMGFNYNKTLFLYNSGYDPAYREFSVGLLSKIFGIRASIQRGFTRWDFLKGNEAYKYNLGGKTVPLSSCQVNFT